MRGMVAKAGIGKASKRAAKRAKSTARAGQGAAAKSTQGVAKASGVKAAGSAFERVFNAIDTILRRDAGVSSEIDYIEQTSWVLFLRYLDGFLENERKLESDLQEGKRYTPLLVDTYQWQSWAAPTKQDADGSIKPDHDRRKGGDLTRFVNDDLFPYLASFKQKAASEGDTTGIYYRIGEIFGELKNKIASSTNLQNILDAVDELDFGTNEQMHELSRLYESKINKMGNAGRNGGEYYTPRPLIRAMIRVLDPGLGKTIYDGACGSAGFLCEAYVDLLKKCKEAGNTAAYNFLKHDTLFGKEKKGLAYIIGIMNMLLHGITAPNIEHTNTLNRDQRSIEDTDRHHYVLANPPFGGSERHEIRENFLFKTGETASLFLQHFIKVLHAGGHAAVVIKNTFLSNVDNASVALRKYLLDKCDLYAILDMPSKTFLGAGVQTVVLFFKKGSPTRSIWYYQLDPGRNLGKTNPLNDADMAEFVRLFAERDANGDRPTTKNSWTVNIADIDLEGNADLSVSNPNTLPPEPLPPPADIIADLHARDQQNAKLLQGIRKLL